MFVSFNILSENPTTRHGSLVGTMPASYARDPEIDPCIRHIVLWKTFPSSTDSRSYRASCQLLVKELALNTGKLPPGSLPRNSVVK